MLIFDDVLNVHLHLVDFSGLVTIHDTAFFNIERNVLKIANSAYKAIQLILKYMTIGY